MDYRGSSDAQALLLGNETLARCAESGSWIELSLVADLVSRGSGEPRALRVVIDNG